MTLRDVAREHKTLPLSLLDAPAIDLRMGRDEPKLADITASIQRHGLLQPIIVVRAGERFEIVDGFTRFLCAGRAGLVAVPCYIYAERTAALEGAKYDTATMRLDLTPAEEATYFHALFEGDCGQDIDAVAARVGRSRNYVDSRIALLLGDAEIFAAVRAETITLGVAAQLNCIPDESWRRYYLAHAIKGGASVSMVQGWVTDWKNTYGERVAVAPGPELASAAPIIAEYDPRRCYCCGKVDPRFLPEQVSIHTHCRLAILDPLLTAYRGEDTGSSQ